MEANKSSSVYPVVDYIQSNYREDYQLGHHFWNFLTKPQSKAPYEESSKALSLRFHEHSDEEADQVEDDVDMQSEEDFEDNIEATLPQDMPIAYPYTETPQSQSQSRCVPTEYYSYIEVPQDMTTNYSYVQVSQGMEAVYQTEVPPPQAMPPKTSRIDVQDDANVDYKAFVEATKEGNWSAMKNFLESHARALTAKLFRYKGTALHHALDFGKKNIAESLVDRMTPGDLEIRDKDGHTPLALGANYHYPGIFKLLESMVKKNPNLPNLGDYRKVPVVVASLKGFKDTTRFLYRVTDKTILSPDHDYGKVGVQLLNQCINIKLFDIASELIQKFPRILQLRDDDGISPIQALARTFSASQSRIGFGHKPLGDEELVRNETRVFLRLICKEVSTYEVETLTRVAYTSMIEAAKRGSVDFIVEMVKANPDLMWAKDEEGKTMFWHAIMNRQENVFNLIYGEQARDHKDSLLSCDLNDERNNMLHFAAMLPQQSILDRVAGPALQMQRELQWFREVRDIARPRYREDVNKENFTPRELFTSSHKNLLDAAEKYMKATAQSATTVGALIITMMFAATFAVPRTDNQTTGHSLFVTRGILTAFIICDALSLYSSIASVLVFLGILTSRYSEEDFLVKLPRKLMAGLYALFFSITTMMVTFCIAITIMFDRLVQFILPVVVLACFTIALFVYSVLPLIREILLSPFGSSIFQSNGDSRAEIMEESDQPLIKDII